MSHYFYPVVSIVAIVLLAAAGGWAINRSATRTADAQARILYTTQYNSCIRGNKLRREINARVPSDLALTRSLLSFLSSARTARLASYKLTHEKADLVAAKEYLIQIESVSRSVHYKKVSIANCHEVIIKP